MLYIISIFIGIFVISTCMYISMHEAETIFHSKNDIIDCNERIKQYYNDYINACREEMMINKCHESLETELAYLKEFEQDRYEKCIKLINCNTNIPVIRIESTDTEHEMEEMYKCLKGYGKPNGIMYFEWPNCIDENGKCLSGIVNVENNNITEVICTNNFEHVLKAIMNKNKVKKTKNKK